MQFDIPNMACGGCVDTITQAVQSVDPTADVQADTTTRRVTIASDERESQIRTALVEAGYPPA